MKKKIVYPNFYLFGKTNKSFKGEIYAHIRVDRFKTKPTTA